MNFRDRYSYDVQRDLLGKGGFSTVYKAEDKLLNRFVALKFFKNQELHKYDVLAEIRKVIQLEHPNITRYYDVATLENRTVHGEVEKVQVGVMEYINGGDIKTYLKSNPQHFDNLITQILEGIQYLHNNGIIHRDLKPQNILVKDQNRVVTTKITDFGISKLVDSASTTTHGLLGTLAYMAPEQLDPKHFGIDGKINTNLDFWSFGILLYDLLTDSHPFIDNNSNTAEQIMRSILMGDIDGKINSIKNPVYRRMLEKCLVKDANKRVRNAHELLNIKFEPKIEKPIVQSIDDEKTSNNLKINNDVNDISGIFGLGVISSFVLIWLIFFKSEIEWYHWIIIAICGLFSLSAILNIVEYAKNNSKR
jgi:serine/threonine protein kinase